MPRHHRYSSWNSHSQHVHLNDPSLSQLQTACDVTASSFPTEDPSPSIDFSRLETHVSELSFSSRDTHEQRSRKTQLLELYRSVTKRRYIVERVRSLEAAARAIMSAGAALMHEEFDEIASAATSNLASFYASSLAEQHCTTFSATSAMQNTWLTFIVNSVLELLELKLDDCAQPRADAPASAVATASPAETLNAEVAAETTFQLLHAAACDSTMSGSMETASDQDLSQSQRTTPSFESFHTQASATASIGAVSIVDDPCACHICQRTFKSASLTQGISANGCPHRFCRACLRKQYRVDFTDVSWRIISWPCPVCSRNCTVRSLYTHVVLLRIQLCEFYSSTRFGFPFCLHSIFQCQNCAGATLDPVFEQQREVLLASRPKRRRTDVGSSLNKTEVCTAPRLQDYLRTASNSAVGADSNKGASSSSLLNADDFSISFPWLFGTKSSMQSQADADADPIIQFLAHVASFPKATLRVIKSILHRRSTGTYFSQAFNAVVAPATFDHGSASHDAALELPVAIQVADAGLAIDDGTSPGSRSMLLAPSLLRPPPGKRIRVTYVPWNETENEDAAEVHSRMQSVVDALMKLAPIRQLLPCQFPGLLTLHQILSDAVSYRYTETDEFVEDVRELLHAARQSDQASSFDASAVDMNQLRAQSVAAAAGVVSIQFESMVSRILFAARAQPRRDVPVSSAAAAEMLFADSPRMPLSSSSADSCDADLVSAADHLVGTNAASLADNGACDDTISADMDVGGNSSTTCVASEFTLRAIQQTMPTLASSPPATAALPASLWPTTSASSSISMPHAISESSVSSSAFGSELSVAMHDDRYQNSEILHDEHGTAQAASSSFTITNNQLASCPPSSSSIDAGGSSNTGSAADVELTSAVSDSDHKHEAATDSNESHEASVLRKLKEYHERTGTTLSGIARLANINSRGLYSFFKTNSCPSRPTLQALSRFLQSV